MRLFGVLALVAAAALPAGALTLLPITFDDLVAQSAVVVYGRVADVRGVWTADRRAIDSFVSLQALEYFKGALGERVTFKVPGGEAGGLVMAVPGAPVLRDGDLVVVFLSGSGPAVPAPVGVSQGVYRVVPGSDGALRVLSPRGAAGAARATGGPTPAAGLAAFGTHVRAAGGVGR